jgi:hypothetical protein
MLLLFFLRVDGFFSSFFVRDAIPNASAFAG